VGARELGQGNQVLRVECGKAQRDILPVLQGEESKFEYDRYLLDVGAKLENIPLRFGFGPPYHFLLSRQGCARDLLDFENFLLYVLVSYNERLLEACIGPQVFLGALLFGSHVRICFETDL
jgi:hypothetical protein